MSIKTSKLEERLNKASKISLSTILKDVPHTDFVLYLNELLDESELLKSDVIKKTTLDRTYAYQIFSGERLPGKDKVIQIALALNCNLEETNRLLTLTSNASLYAKVKRDAVLLFAISEHYSVMETNELLIKYKMEEL